MLTKKDLIAKVHADSDISKRVIEQVVDDFLAALCNEIIAGNEVRIFELGIFKIAVREAGKGYNPLTGEAIDVPERRVPRLKFSAAIRRAINAD